MNIVFIAVAIMVIVLAILVSKLWLKKPGIEGAYKARALMTENEAEFFGRLIAALPDHYIFPQVAMTALLEPQTRDKKKAHSDRLRIAQQRVDYVVSDKVCNCIAVIELDDRTHSGSKDQVRDTRLQNAGIRTIRFQSRSKPSIDAIREAILPAVATRAAQLGAASK